MIDFRSLVRVATQSLLRNKSRSLLTTLGIVIGVAAVILLVSIGTGLQGYVAKQFESLGANTIYVMPFKATDAQGRLQAGAEGGSTMRGFNNRDLLVVKRVGAPVTTAVAMIERSVDVSFRGKTKTQLAVASGAEYLEVRGAQMAQGEWFSKADEEQGKRVVVVGSQLATDLFGDDTPVGKSILIGASSFRVIGVMAKIGSAGIGPNVDEAVYLSVPAAERLFNVDTFSMMVVKVTTAEAIPEATKAIEEALSRTRKKDEYSVLDQRQILDTITGILGTLTVGIGGIAAISLLVGGIGIMNIMLVSVTERTREIGLRKAVGATPTVILLQFLIEAVVLSLLGGMMGVSLGFGGSLLLRRFLPTEVSWGSVALAFGVSAAVGIVFGILPARRAAKLSPINALRYE